MGALDPAKILMVLVIALIVLGPDKLPRVARQLGAAWRELTKFREHVEQEVRSAIPDVDLPKLPTRPSSAVATFLSDLTAPMKAPISDVKSALADTAASVSSGPNGTADAGGPHTVADDGGVPVDGTAALNGAGELNGASSHSDQDTGDRAAAMPDPIPIPPRGAKVFELPIAPDDPSMN